MKTDAVEAAILSHQAARRERPASAVSRGQTAKGNGRTVRSAFYRTAAAGTTVALPTPERLRVAPTDWAHNVL